MTAARRLSVDAQAAALQVVAADPNTLLLLSAYGDEPANRVGGPDRPPYPRLLFATVDGGDDANMRWVYTTPVQITAIGDLDGRPGSAALRGLLYTAVAAVAALPATEVTDPTLPVWTRFRAPGNASWRPLPGGQPRWQHTVYLTGHPPKVS